MSKRVLVIEDHPVFRKGLVALVGEVAGVDEVVEASTGAQGVAHWGTSEFDLVTVDLQLPDANGLELLRRARTEQWAGAVFIISVHDDPAYAVRVKAEGGAGYFPKTAEMDLLAAAVSRSLAGHQAFQTVGGKLFTFGTSGGAPVSIDSLASLTAMERRILSLLGQHLTSRAIAMALGLSVRTVENHRANMCRKLDLRGPHRLLEFAMSVAAMLDEASQPSELS